MTNTDREEWPTPYSLQDVIERAEEQRATVLAIPRLELAKVVEAWVADRATMERYHEALTNIAGGIGLTDADLDALDSGQPSLAVWLQRRATLALQSPTQAPLQVEPT